MTAPDVRRRIDALADVLAGNGELTDERWREALHAAPRHLFVPDVAWTTPYAGDGYRIDRRADPVAWLEAAYGDQAVITQLDDGAVDVGTGQGDYTSSLSAPGVVLDFLELLDPFDGDEVLEIGTGSGWTAALLACRLGEGNVTSIEVDPAVAEAAAANIKEAGYTPTLVVGEGGGGFPAGAPFDRVHVTCGVTTVPYTWVEQTRPGGLIAFPWMPEHQGGHKTVLTAVGDGTAVGRFHGGASYMMLRAQRPSRDRTEEDDWRESTTMLDPRRVVRAAWGADVAIAGMLPDVSSQAEDVDSGGFRLWLWAAGSAAVVTYSPEYKRCSVLQRGSRDLWDEVSDAFRGWIRFGMPGRDRFGMTVTPDGQQVWLDSPDRVLTPLA